MKEDSVFAFAGIWDRWSPQRGPVIESCAILTTTRCCTARTSLFRPWLISRRVLARPQNDVLRIELEQQRPNSCKRFGMILLHVTLDSIMSEEALKITATDGEVQEVVSKRVRQILEDFIGLCLKGTRRLCQSPSLLCWVISLQGVPHGCGFYVPDN